MLDARFYYIVNCHLKALELYIFVRDLKGGANSRGRLIIEIEKALSNNI